MEVEGPSRQPQQAVGEAGDSSSNSRKRARFVTQLEDLVDETEQEPVSEAENNGSHDHDSAEEEEEEEEEEEDDDDEEEQSESEGELDGSDGDTPAEDQHNEQQPQSGGGGNDRRSQRRVVVLDDDDMHSSFPCTVIPQGSTAPALLSPRPSSASCPDNSVVRDVTVNSSALDCGICFLPLKPPIFQCNVGHVVCSRCHDKLGVPCSCHVCRALTPGGYQRCHAMEQLVDSIRIPCPHAAHGCTDRPVYHNSEVHAKACAHAPCCCPEQGCSFVGSTAALLQHFTALHRWPCTTENKAGDGFDVNLCDGFNFVTAVRAGANQGATNKYLFVLNVEQAPFGRTITVFCIHPHHTSTATLRLTYGCYRSFDMCWTHHQASEFKVACTDLSKGLPNPSECFVFIVPRSAHRDDEEFTKVNVVIHQTPIQ
ncbi:unnamed protein product [Urochloa decumbens]|uniref:RING-type E3 ubiquitin transferase n=1 Tax=Urochloa decumbens TaxID=240449 RepID=A0ABC9GKL1_9POAL